MATVGRRWRRFRRRPGAMKGRCSSIAAVVVVIVVDRRARRGTPGSSRAPPRPGAVDGGLTGATPDAQATPAAPARAPGVSAIEHQRGVPGHQPQQPGRQGGPGQRQGVRRAERGHPHLRQPDQRRRRHQRPQDRRRHRRVRPDRRRRHACPVQAVDPGQPAGLRGARRHRRLDGRQPAVRHPAGPDADAQRLDHGDDWTTQAVARTCGGPAPTRRPSCRPLVQWGISRAASATARRWASWCRTRRPTRPHSTTYCCRPSRRRASRRWSRTIAASPDQTATTVLRGPAGRRAVQRRRRAVGDPADARRTPSSPIWGPRPQQYYPQLLLRTTSRRSRSRSGSSPCPTRRHSTARRASPPRRWAASTTTAPRARAATTRACARATPPGRPTTRSRSPARRASTSRSRAHSGLVRSIRLFAAAAKAPARPQPAHLRAGHGQDRQLPRHPRTRSELRPDQVLRPDPVPGGQDPQQRAARRRSATQDNHKPQGTCWVTVQPFSRCPRRRRVPPGTRR